MNLGDQLQELRQVILRDRSDLIAGDSDSFWTDETLLRYIGDAESRFARETALLWDGNTPKYTQLKLKVGVRDYPLQREVFAVLSGRATGRDYDLQRTGHMLVQARPPDASLTFDPNEANTIPPGAPLGFYTDETAVFASQQVVTFSVYPVPDATTDGLLVNLRVARVPTDCYTTGDLKRESEIPRAYQLDVLEWAAYRAKRNNDVDIGQSPPAADHKAAFEDAIKRGIKDRRRRMHAATGLHFGGNGFSWGR